MHKLRALRASFEESLQYLAGATASLGDGRPPTEAATLRLQSLQEQFVQVRESLLDEAALHGVEAPAQMDSLDALESLGEAIEAKRRQGLHDRIGDVLSRAASLCHQEEVVFQSLQQIREEAVALRGDKASLEELERLLDGSHPFVPLLRLVEGGDDLSHEEALSLSQVVEETFGRALAVGVLRKRLLLGPTEQPSSHSLPSLLSGEPPVLSPSGIYEEALEAGRRANANLPPIPVFGEASSASNASHSGASHSGASLSGASLSGASHSATSADELGFPTQEEEPKPATSAVFGTSGSNGALTDNGAGIPPVAKRKGDTWDELPAAEASGKYQSVSLIGDLGDANVPPAPFMLASSATSNQIEPPTDEVPVIQSESISGHFSDGFMFGEGGMSDEEEPTVEEQGYSPIHIPNEVGLIEVPSIELMAVSAMNAVLLPGGISQDDLPVEFQEPSSPPKPPSSPRKLPTPTFLTPLPLSVTMAPGGVLQPNQQHELAKAAALSGGSHDMLPFGSYSGSSLDAATGYSSPSHSSPSLSSLSSPSLPLDSYDAMLIRKADPHDPSRSSPLTVWQEAELMRQEHGVAVLFGSSALGLEDLTDFVELSVGSEQLYVIDQVYAPHRFLRQIRQIAGRRDGTMTFVLVTHQTPWDSSWVRGALELVSQMKANTRPLRITFVADPPSTWSMIPSIQPLQQDGAMMLSLQPWHDSALLKWLQQLDFPFDHKIRRSIRRVTGNWSFALKFFYRQMKQSPNQWARHLGSLKQVLESRELAQKALRIMGLTHKTTLSILHKLTIEEPATQESMERAFAHAPPRLITRALLWAERLSLAQYENYFWTTNPLVARLLKSLR